MIVNNQPRRCLMTHDGDFQKWCMEEFRKHLLSIHWDILVLYIGEFFFLSERFHVLQWSALSAIEWDAWTLQTVPHNILHCMQKAQMIKPATSEKGITILFLAAQYRSYYTTTSTTTSDNNDNNAISTIIMKTISFISLQTILYKINVP